jgi:hypothetical protein
MKKPIYFILFLYAVICALTINNFNGTGDSGDSIVHYLFARYAPYHPELFFDHWAKPVFVLLASPFAQFGFTGIKIFNSIISLTTLFFTYRTAVLLNLRNAILVPVIMMFSPLNYILTFSGLTEPLFALFCILGIYLCVKNRFIAAALLISFLPFVRSEGLIIIGVFILYFIYKKSWKVIPCLLAGSVTYSLAGYFAHHDILWVFTKIPYATLNSVYGQGGIFHFVEQLISLTGVPLYILFCVGVGATAFNSIRKKLAAEETVLVFLGFGAFFVAHSLFWYLGIFNSMGLKRVLIGVMPMIAIITLQGFNLITEDLLQTVKLIRKPVRIFLMVYILIFPFTPNPYSIHWREDMMLSNEQELAAEAAKSILKQSKINYPLYYNDHYLSVVFNVDDFDRSKCKKIFREYLSEMTKGDYIIWDNRFAEVESDIKKKELDSLSGFTNLYIYKNTERGKTVMFSAFARN